MLTCARARLGWKVVFINERKQVEDKQSFMKNIRKCSSTEQPWSQGSGLKEPTDGHSEVMETQSRKDHPSILLLYSVISFLSSSHPHLTFSASLLSSTSWPPHRRKWGGERARVVHKARRQKSGKPAKQTGYTERNEAEMGRAERRHAQESVGEKGGGRETTDLSPPPPAPSLSSSLSLICSGLSGKSRGGQVSPAGFWPRQSGQGHRWDQGRLHGSVLHHK